MVVVATAFVDLPVDAGGGVVMLLDTIHAKVVAAAFGVFGINQGQGDKRPTVAMPGGQHGQSGELCRALAIFEDRS